MVKAMVLDVDVEKERITLGIKQLERAASPMAATPSAAGVKKGDVVTVTVLEVRDGGIEVQVGDDGATGFIKRADLGRDRDEQRPDRFQVGDRRSTPDGDRLRHRRRAELSRSRRCEIAEEKEAVAQFGSSDFGRLARRHPGRRAEGQKRG